jgi:4-amino-4-deoxy-L-arabinose transferase-like glycosyltransferase
LRLGILSYWMNTYWCASVAALGGALVLGAWPRLRRNMHPRHGLILALGLVLLANSRPYEGFVFSIPVAIAILAWFTRRPRLQINKAIPALVVALVVVAGGAAATGFYYYRVTGSPWVMTYQVNRSQYSAAPYFVWQKLRAEPMYHHAVMCDYYRGEAREFQRNLTLRGYLQRGTQKFLEWWKFYLGPLLTVPLLPLPWVIRQRKMRLPLAICAAMIAGFAVQTWTLPHYFSPAAGALYILLVQGLRHMYAHRGRAKDAALAIPILACAMIILRVMAAATHTQIEPAWPRGNLERAVILRQLRAMPGDQLVLVRYGPDHDVDREWVWNRASIDSAKVIWARDMGATENQELLEYFKDRRIWQLDSDDPAPTLQPYTAAPPR